MKFELCGHVCGLRVALSMGGGAKFKCCVYKRQRTNAADLTFKRSGSAAEIRNDFSLSNKQINKLKKSTVGEFTCSIFRKIVLNLPQTDSTSTVLHD